MHGGIRTLAVRPRRNHSPLVAAGLQRRGRDPTSATPNSVAPKHRPADWHASAVRRGEQKSLFRCIPVHGPLDSHPSHVPPFGAPPLPSACLTSSLAPHTRLRAGVSRVSVVLGVRKRCFLLPVFCCSDVRFGRRAFGCPGAKYQKNRSRKCFSGLEPGRTLVYPALIFEPDLILRVPVPKILLKSQKTQRSLNPPPLKSRLFNIIFLFFCLCFPSFLFCVRFFPKIPFPTPVFSA